MCGGRGWGKGKRWEKAATNLYTVAWATGGGRREKILAEAGGEEKIGVRLDAIADVNL